MKLSIALFLLSLAATAHAQEVVTLSTRPGVTQSYFLARVPEKPQVIALLFPGGDGSMQLRTEKGQIKFVSLGNNFLVRSRAEFVKRAAITAIADAPSDQQRGMSDEFRLGEQHFADISAVVADLTKRHPGVPLFLIGTSRGTVSAAALGARFGQQLSGVVLTATLFLRSPPRARDKGPGLSGFDFASIKIPLLFVHHVGDQCHVTPYGEALWLSEKYPLISVFGGLPPRSEECEAQSTHGFFGKESGTVEEIVNWMLKKPFRKEVQ